MAQEAIKIINHQIAPITLVLCPLRHHLFHKEFDDIGALRIVKSWVKDVIYTEDTSPQLQGKASTNISILKSWVLNLLRIHGYDSIKEAIDALSHNLDFIRYFCY